MESFTTMGYGSGRPLAEGIQSSGEHATDGAAADPAVAENPVAENPVAENPVINYKGSDILLTLQRPRTDAAAEPAFLIVTQVMKLLFKLTAIEVIRTRDYLWRAICAAPDERGELYHLAEALMDLAYELGRWRSVHLLTVERLLGLSRALAVPQGSAGRGGSPGTISSPSCGRPGRRCEEIPKAGQAND